MTFALRGSEIDSCLHRIALGRIEPFASQRTTASPEQERRRREAEDNRRTVLARLKDLYPEAITSSGHQHTEELIASGCALILRPLLGDRSDNALTTSVNALIRVGRVDEKYKYAPLIIKNHEVTEPSTVRSLMEGSFEKLLPNDAVERSGLGLRSTPTVKRDGLILSGALRILESHQSNDPLFRGCVVDRNGRFWWLDLQSDSLAKMNLSAFDVLYQERKEVLQALEAWQEVGGEFPTAPYWHRDCLNCDFSEHCEQELEAIDDVSLTRFTNKEQQRLLKENGIATRVALSKLDPHRARASRAKATTPPLEGPVEDLLSRSIEKLDDLIYRARAHVSGSFLRIGEPEKMGCPTADVEIDIDMESYNDVTYLWGAYVTHNTPVAGLEPGYYSFVEWNELNEETEAAVFTSFWHWLTSVRQLCREQGRSLAAYCFWAQAEDGSMNRAVLSSPPGGPTQKDLDSFRAQQPKQWIDLHELAKNQIQTEGPLGLKMLAMAAGFSWRDENPSGEASMLWYEVASRDESVEALASRSRLLAYNEDDCRATKALRDWLNGPAQQLAHRDEIPQGSAH